MARGPLLRRGMPASAATPCIVAQDRGWFELHRALSGAQMVGFAGARALVVSVLCFSHVLVCGFNLCLAMFKVLRVENGPDC